MSTETDETSPDVEESPEPVELQAALQQILNPAPDPKVQKLAKLQEAIKFLRDQYLIDMVTESYYNKQMLVLHAELASLGHPKAAENFIQSLPAKYLEGDFEVECGQDQEFFAAMHQLAESFVASGSVQMAPTFYSNYTGPIVRA